MTKDRYHRTWMRGGIPTLTFAVVLLVGACDFQLLEPLEVPRWGISLTIPLINKSYPLIDVVDSSTIFHDTTSQELQIEFRGDLDTTTIDSSFLEVSLPAAASPPPINESVNAPDAADFFVVLAETVTVTISLADLLNDAGFPLPASLPVGFDIGIPQFNWNAVADSPVDQQEGPFQIIDTTALVADNDFIQRFRYVQLDGAALTSRFYTNVISTDFPENIDTVDIALVANPLAVNHLTTALAPNTSDAQTTDLASAQLGSEMAVGIHVVLPTVGSDPTILANTDPSITLEVILEVGGVDSLAITTARTSLLPSPPDPLPLPGTIEITEGVLRSPVTAPINQISLSNLGTSLPFDILFQLTFPNFASSPAKADSLIFGPYTLQKGQPLVNQDASIAGYTFYNPAGGGPLTEFNYELVVDILEKDIVLPLDGSPLGNFLADFEFGDGDGDGLGDLHFESITGNFFLTFDTVPTTIDDIPTGFAGFEFGRLSLSLLLRNQIELPVMLNLELKGKRTLEGDSVSVPINADINFPGAPGAPAANGDTAYTLIIMDGDAVRTYWLPQGARDTSDAWYRATTPVPPDSSIVDVMNLPPDILSVGGSAIIRGEGVVEAGKGVWGEFELIAPFAFVLPQEVTFLPVNNIPLPPMDEGTRTQIKTALISASLTSQVSTQFPIGGNISLLISDTTLFSLALDKLDSVDAGIPTQARNGDTTYYDNISAVLAADSIFNVQDIAYYPEKTGGPLSSALGTRARRVEFFTTTGDTFWIGRLFEMELPSPKATNALGHVTAGGDTTQVIAMDADRVAWIASDKTLYMKPLITWYNTPDVRTIQATNTIDFTAFMSFNLTSDIITEVEPLDTVITATAPTMTTVAVDSLLIIDLGTVFGLDSSSATIADLDLSATSGHPGIVSIARIRTDGNTKVMELLGVRRGKAQVTVTGDDGETTPVSVSFYVTVVP